MTGEITLRGKVLPIGGIKEKVLAAARFGLKRVILPRRNESDLDDVPEAVREQIEFVLVDTVDEVLEAALLPQDAGDDGHPAEQHKIEKDTEKDRAAAVAHDGDNGRIDAEEISDKGDGIDTEEISDEMVTNS